MIITNECSKTLDAELIKRFSGGGDQIQMRKLYQNAISVRPHGMLCMMMNEGAIAGLFNRVDGALMNRMKASHFGYSFVENPKKSNEKLADPEIKRKFEMNELYRRAMIELVIDGFHNK